MQSTQENELPAGWRPEWREPKKRRSKKAEYARARETVAEIAPANAELLASTYAHAAPAPEDIYDRAVNVLIEIAENTTLLENARVGAARTLAELATRGRVGGNDTARLSDEEIDRRMAEIEARVMARRLGAKAEGSE